MVSEIIFRCVAWMLIAGTTMLGLGETLSAAEPQQPQCCDTVCPPSTVINSGGEPGVCRLRDKWRGSCHSCLHRAGEVCEKCRGQSNCCRPHCSDYDCSICGQLQMLHDQNQHNCNILSAHLHGKLAYFTPMGNGGEGVSKVGYYQLVYPANPNYSDPRDAKVYAAQGWGVPMSVPLAPNVRYTMNYSTGMPASRLTPISYSPQCGP